MHFQKQIYVYLWVIAVYYEQSLFELELEHLVLDFGLLYRTANFYIDA